MQDRILIIGASGQIGVELTLALRQIYGLSNVIASDIRPAHPLLADGPYMIVNGMDEQTVHMLIKREHITQVYLLAAVLSATGEQNPMRAWDINMKSLLQLL